MITSTNLNALRNLEHFQVMSNVLSYLKEENLEELKLSAFAESFEKQLKVYDEVLVLERGNVLSLKLTDADKKRDDAYRALAGIVKAYTVFPEGIAVSPGIFGSCDRSRTRSSSVSQKRVPPTHRHPIVYAAFRYLRTKSSSMTILLPFSPLPCPSNHGGQPECGHNPPPH